MPLRTDAVLSATALRDGLLDDADGEACEVSAKPRAKKEGSASHESKRRAIVSREASNSSAKGKL